MHSNISLEISPSQVESLVEKLPLENKLHLVRRLEKETFANRIDNVADRMRGRIKSAKVSAKEIDRICEEVKMAYDKKQHLRNRRDL